jgi:hypothetical protein
MDREFEADQGGPERDAAHEAARAVDGIDDPAKTRATWRGAGFLAQEAVVRGTGSGACFGAVARPRDRPG